MALEAGNYSNYNCGVNSYIYSCDNSLAVRFNAQWNHLIFYHVERIDG